MIIDEALVLVDGAGGTNVIDCGERPVDANGVYLPGSQPTGGYNNLSGWLNIKTSASSGSIKLQESVDNSTYTDVAGASWTISAAGSFSVPMPKTTKRYVKATLTTLTSSNTSAFIGGLAYAKELA